MTMEGRAPRSEDLMRKLESEGQHELALTDDRLQPYLIKFLYPNDPMAAMKWLEGGTKGEGEDVVHYPPLSAAYRDYRDKFGKDRMVDFKNDIQMQKVLDDILEHAKKALH